MGGGDCKCGFDFVLGADRVAVALGGVWCADGSEERRKLYKCAIEHVAVAVGGMFYMLFAGYIYFKGSAPPADPLEVFEMLCVLLLW